MRACSVICVIGIISLMIDEFCNGLNWEKLFIGGFVVVAIWTDFEPWLLYKLRKTKKRGNAS